MDRQWGSDLDVPSNPAKNPWLLVVPPLSLVCCSCTNAKTFFYSGYNDQRSLVVRHGPRCAVTSKWTPWLSSGGVTSMLDDFA